MESEKDAPPLALKNIVTGQEKTIVEKDQHYCLLVLTMVCCSEAPLPCFCLSASQSLKKHICVSTNTVVTQFLCLAAGFSLSVLLLQNLTHHGILLSTRAPNSTGKPLTSNPTLSKKKSSWSQRGISLCAAFKERVWEHQIGLKVGNSRTDSLDSQEEYNWYQRKVF